MERREVNPPVPVRQTDNIKGTSDTLALLTGAGTAISAMEQPHKPVPQGKRGILWDRPGQISHLPPPSVSIALPSPGAGSHTPVPGMRSKAVLPPDNTAQSLYRGGLARPAPVFPVTECGRKTDRAGPPQLSSRTGCGTLRRKGRSFAAQGISFSGQHRRR